MLIPLLMLSLLFLVLLGFYVFVAAPRSHAHQAFAAFVGCLALWTIKDIIFWGFEANNTGAVWWASSSFVISVIMQYALVVFAFSFPGNEPVPLRRCALIFAPGLAFIPAAVLGLMWKQIGFVNDSFVIVLSPLAYVFGVYVYGVYGYGFVTLYRKYRTRAGTQQAKQIASLLYALLITLVLMSLASVLLPSMGSYKLLPISSVFVLPGVLIYSYAISNFKLFSFQSALDQFRLFPIAFKVALSIAAVAMLSFALLQVPIAWWSFHAAHGYEAWRRYVVFSVMSALLPNLMLVFLIVRSISRPVRRITEAAVNVARGAYGTRVDLETSDEFGLLAQSFNEMSAKMARDIVQLQNMNDQLVRTEKLAAVGTLAAGVAHEVNNPLGSMSSLVQLLQSRPMDQQETQEMLKLIATQIDRIARVTREMMEFARATPAARADHSINDIVTASLRLASFDKEFQRIDLNLDLLPDPALINSDWDQMQQVLLNLLLNARDAMADGGSLTVRTRYNARADMIVIEIVDSGLGIPEAHRQHIFDPFYTTKPAGKGTGLGLAVCYGIVNAHGGTIEVSANSECGSTFTVALPVALKAADFQ